MGINPIKLYGNWNDGYALDVHVVKSEPIGEDMYGHMQFHTVRSEIGELIYHYKYKNRHPIWLFLHSCGFARFKTGYVGMCGNIRQMPLRCS